MTRKALPGRILMLAAVALAAAALLARPQLAAAAGPEVQFSAEAADDGTWRLEATVVGADGSALSQVPVTFAAATDFFGDRWIPLGSSVTSTSGVATVIYVPTSNGDQEIVARAATSDGSLESQPLVVHINDAVPAVPLEGPDLPIVRAWALPIGIAVVLLVWMLLGGIFLYAVLGIARQPMVVQAPHRVPPRVDGLESVESRVDGGSDS